MRHIASKAFWQCYDDLPPAIQRLADGKFQLLSENPRHPSVDLMPLRSSIWRARVGDHYRALAKKERRCF